VKDKTNGRNGRHITQEMINHLDERAGKQHSSEGRVMVTLRELIEMYEASSALASELGPNSREGG
jgi:hypothetical protein